MSLHFYYSNIIETRSDRIQFFFIFNIYFYFYALNNSQDINLWDIFGKILKAKTEMLKLILCIIGWGYWEFKSCTYFNVDINYLELNNN